MLTRNVLRLKIVILQLSLINVAFHSKTFLRLHRYPTYLLTNWKERENMGCQTLIISSDERTKGNLLERINANDRIPVRLNLNLIMAEINFLSFTFPNHVLHKMLSCKLGAATVINFSPLYFYLSELRLELNCF